MGLDIYHLKKIDCSQFENFYELKTTCLEIEQMSMYDFLDVVCEKYNLTKYNYRIHEKEIYQEVGYQRKGMQDEAWEVAHDYNCHIDDEEGMLRLYECCIDKDENGNDYSYYRDNFKENFVDKWEEGLSFIDFNY